MPNDTTLTHALFYCSDWNQFKNYVTFPSYLDYMIRTNKITSTILSSLSQFLDRYDPEYFLEDNPISVVYELIQRRKHGGADLIKHFCSMLTDC